MCTPLSHGFLLALELQCSSNLVFEATVAPLRHDTPIEKPHVVICLTPVLNFIACFKIAPAGTVLKVGLSKFFFFRVSLALTDLDKRRQRAREQVRARAGGTMGA